MPAKGKLDSIVNLLIKHNFYQINKHIDAGWFHSSGLIAYYVRNKKYNYYTLRFKQEVIEIKTVKELNTMLTSFKNRKILK
jgi:hypothetical protein